MAFQDGSVYFSATGFLEARGFESVVSFYGKGSMSVYALSSVDLQGTLDFSSSSYPTINSATVVDSFVSFYGFGSMIADSKGSIAVCTNLYINKDIQHLYSDQCTGGESDMIQRYRGDDYPVMGNFGIENDFDITGFTFKMSTKIGEGTTYTSDGTILDSASGLVEFQWPSGSIDNAGEGVYDIQGNDGTYTYTYEAGVFILLDDVTK